MKKNRVNQVVKKAILPIRPSFEESIYYESLLKLRVDNPKAFDALSNVTHNCLRLYQMAKANSRTTTTKQ
jgi:molybdenum cofactor biosynthesis enzyme